MFRLPSAPDLIAPPAPLLASKWVIPTPLAAALPRRHLVAQLDEATARRLTLLTAPAGYGKTTLLALWARERGEARPPVAWLSLEAGDNDPARFLAYLAAALHAIGVVELPDDPGSGTPAAVEAQLTTLLNQVAASGQRFVLVLDGIEELFHPTILGAMTFLFDHLPTPMHLLLSGRCEPPLPLARLRVAGQLALLGAEALRATVQECVLLSERTPILSLDAPTLEALYCKSEGWLAGLHLVLLAAAEQDDPNGALATLTGAHRYLVAYFEEEVMARLPRPLQRALTQCSIVDPLAATLVAALLPERGDGVEPAEMLDRMVARRLFLEPVPAQPGRYRFHPLFADFLRCRLARTERARIPELHRRASRWYAAQENPDLPRAIHHALAAADWPFATELLRAAAGPMRERGEEGTLQQWLALLPDGMRPSLAPALPPPELADPLSARERELLALLTGDLTTPEIAARLVLAVGTVRWYIKGLYRKLDVHSRAEAIDRARALQLL